MVCGGWVSVCVYACALVDEIHALFYIYIFMYIYTIFISYLYLYLFT